MQTYRDDQPVLAMQLAKLAVEIGPLVIFFLGNAQFGIFAATGAFMAATVLSLLAGKLLFGKLAAMPLVTGVFVLIFGGLTLYFHNDTFIKIKPTLVNLFISAVLAGGMMAGRPILKYLLGDVLPLNAEGWRQMTWRWSGFFLFLALLNEIVWRSFSTDFWVSFKVFGIMPLTLLFSLAQIGLLQRYQLTNEAQSEPAGDEA